MRPRELWFFLAAAFLAVGGVLVALAVAYYTKLPDYSLSTGPHMIGAYSAFGAALLSGMAGILGWRPWRRWQRFPNLVVRIDAQGNAAGREPLGDAWIPRPLLLAKIHLLNNEADRPASIRTIYLRGRTKQGSNWGYWHVFTGPRGAVEYADPQTPLTFPIDLAPQASNGGWLVFDLFDPGSITDWSAGPAELEIIDAVSGKWMSCPLMIGEYTRQSGLRPTTMAERVYGPPPPPIMTRGAPWERVGSAWEEGVPRNYRDIAN